MNSKTDKLIDEINQLLSCYKVATQEFPNDDISMFQHAVECKRASDYEQSIKIYISLIKKQKAIYTFLLNGLFKSVACAGHVSFAYKLCLIGDQAMRNNGYLWNNFYDHIEKINYAIETDTIYEYLRSISGGGIINGKII